MQLLSGVNVCCRNDHEYAVERGYKETYAAFGQAQECDGYDERHRCSDCGVAVYDVLELVFADHVACRKEYAVVDGVAQSYQSYSGTVRFTAMRAASSNMSFTLTFILEASSARQNIMKSVGRNQKYPITLVCG